MDTKQQIIMSALELFFNNGYEKTSLNDITGKVSITKPALYYYFKNKHELFIEVVNFFLSDMERLINSTIYSLTDIKKMLEASFCSLNEIITYFQKLFKSKNDNAILNNYFFIYDAFKRYPESKDIMRKLYAKSIESMKQALIIAKNEGKIRSDIDCDVIAFEINALLEGIMLMKIVDPSLELDKIGKKIFENYWIRLE